MRLRNPAAPAGRTPAARSARSSTRCCADGERFSAFRAASGAGFGVGGFEPHPALAVPVEVVLALLGEELDGACEPVAGFQRAFDGVVVEVGVEHGGLASQHRRGVRVGVADQGVAVEPGYAPVHLRVAGQAGFEGEDVPGEVPVGLVDGVEPGLGAQHREPRRPDVGRHQVTAGFEGDLQQVAGVEPEDGPPVGGEVADPPEAAGELLRGGEVRQVAQMVDLAGVLAVLVDGGDLAGEHEPHVAAAVRGHRRGDLPVQLGTQPQQPWFGGFEDFAQVREPGGVGEVAGPDHGDALAPRPPRQVLDVAVLAARAGVLRVDVQIGVKAHPVILPVRSPVSGRWVSRMPLAGVVGLGRVGGARRITGVAGARPRSRPDQAVAARRARRRSPRAAADR